MAKINVEVLTESGYKKIGSFKVTGTNPSGLWEKIAGKWHHQSCDVFADTDQCIATVEHYGHIPIMSGQESGVDFRLLNTAPTSY